MGSSGVSGSSQLTFHFRAWNSEADHLVSFRASVRRLVDGPLRWVYELLFVAEGSSLLRRFGFGELVDFGCVDTGVA